MTNVILVFIVALILGLSIAYIVKAKKSGVKCIGCPAGGMCPGNCPGNCSENGSEYFEE